jgi:hypothetical protein
MMFADGVEQAFTASAGQSPWLAGVREALNRAEEFIKPKET